MMERQLVRESDVPRPIIHSVGRPVSHVAVNWSCDLCCLPAGYDGLMGLRWLNVATMATWLRGYVVVATWLLGYLATWLRGYVVMATWLLGYVAAWSSLHGYLATWSWLCGRGYVTMWLHGYVATVFWTVFPLWILVMDISPYVYFLLWLLPIKSTFYSSYGYSLTVAPKQVSL